MNYTIKELDLDTCHKFELGGKTAAIFCTGGGVHEGWLSTSIRIGDAEDVHVGGFKIVDKEEAIELTKTNMASLRADGTRRPVCIRPGDVVEIGAGHNTGGIQEICSLLKLDPEDITNYEYVDLSIRAACLALARQLVSAHSKMPANKTRVRKTKNLSASSQA